MTYIYIFPQIPLSYFKVFKAPHFFLVKVIHIWFGDSIYVIENRVRRDGPAG